MKNKTNIWNTSIYANSVQDEKRIVEEFFQDFSKPYGIFSRQIDKKTIDGATYVLTEHYVDSGSEDYIYTNRYAY